MIKIAIQGAGFVGSAFALVCANAKKKKKYIYDVNKVEKNGINYRKKIKKINSGIFPFKMNDKKIFYAFKKTIGRNLKATNNIAVYKKAKIIISCIDFNTLEKKKDFKKNIIFYKKKISEIMLNIQPSALLIIQTTLPPGTCEKFLIPMFKKILKKRAINRKDILFCHSFERVMPGKGYIDSIRNNWRVYAGINKTSNLKAKKFFESIINFKKFPLTQFDRPIYSETAKILENSYRAFNIAFLNDWGNFAEKINVNLFEVIKSIKLRPTHENLMLPGFGVGGHCLTKDPLFANISSEYVFGFKDQKFDLLKHAVNTNKEMPLNTFKLIKSKFKKKTSKKILIMGVSYKEDIDDTRNSPSALLYNKLKKNFKHIDFCDPLVKKWEELNLEVKNEVPDLSKYDILVLVNKNYQNLHFEKIFKQKKISIFDTNNILTTKKIKKLLKKGIKVFSIGK